MCGSPQVEYLYPPGTLLQSAKNVRAVLGLKRNISRGEGLLAPAAAAPASTAVLRVVDVIPIFGGAA